MRAVFVDLDDTFLAPDKSIPAENRELMDELYQAGIALVPCTGRHVSGVPQQMREHPSVRYIVASNGAVVYDVAAGQDVRVQAIPRKLVVALYQALANQPIAFDAFVDGLVYTEAPRYAYFDVVNVPEGLRGYLKAARTPVACTIPEVLESAGPVTKVCLFFVTDEAREACRRELLRHPELTFVQTSAASYEVMDARVSKGEALCWLAVREGWDIAQVVAFGDNHNDVAMIEAAGVGVAMANGEPDVVARASHVAPPAAEGGVARYLHQLMDAPGHGEDAATLS